MPVINKLSIKQIYPHCPKVRIPKSSNILLQAAKPSTKPAPDVKSKPGSSISIAVSLSIARTLSPENAGLRALL